MDVSGVKKSELVYVENLSASDVLQRKISGKKRTSSSSSISTDTDTDIDTNTPSTSRDCENKSLEHDFITYDQ